MTTRRLAAVMAADVAGFSAMMERDEEGTAARIRALRAEVIEPILTKHHGRLVKTTGDGFLAEFASPVEAARSAIAIQDQLAMSEHRLKLRIGINLGDIIVEHDGDVFGDGVNVAARLEQMADPGGICISGKIHAEVEGKIDRCFEDRGEQQVKNISRPVRVFAVAGLAGRPSGPRPLPLPDKPSIAVLPFTNMSGDPEQEYLADGITEDILTGLSNLRWLFVIARNSSFVFKGRSVDVREVARELGVRYVLEGSVRVAGQRVRITGQLIDSETASHIWAERYDGDLTDIFSLQDRITAGVVASIEPYLFAAEQSRARQKAPGSLTAWDHLMRAMPHVWTWAETDNQTATVELSRAIEADPEYGHAHGLLAWTYMARTHMGWSTLGEVIEPATTAARKAVRLDADNPWAHLALGYVHMVSRRDREAIFELREAVHRNPSFALAHAVLGCAYGYSGAGEKGLAHVRLAARLSPRDPHRATFLSIEGICAFVEGRYAESIDLNRQAAEQRPSFVSALRTLAASCSLVGDLEEARRVLAEARTLQPGLSAEWIERYHPLVRAQDRSIYIEALLKAGLPE
jgi:TolB-like protein/Tfp pilus assembly protein PilF